MSANINRLDSEAIRKMSNADLGEAWAVRVKQNGELFQKGGDTFDLTGDEVARLNANEEDMGLLRTEDARRKSLRAQATQVGADDAALNDPTTRLAFAKGGREGAAAGGEIPGAITGNKSIGELFVESPAFKTYDRNTRRSQPTEIPAAAVWNGADAKGAGYKALLNETGFAPQAIRSDLILPGVLRRPVVADLIPGGTTDQIAIVYMEETTTTNAAAFTNEGAAKPESTLAFTERSAPVRKIATVLPVTDELLNDVSAMRSYIEARLRLFLQLAEETALLSGTNNTAPNFSGLLNTSGILTQAKSTDPIPDAIYKAMVQIQVNSYLDPSGVIFHPLDWQQVRLLRTADGIYIWGSPDSQGPERIWGLPAIVTTAMPQHTALVAAFDSAMQIFRREGVSFAVSDQNEDFFIKNKLMLRVEERLAFPVYRPAGVCQVTGL